MNSRLTCQLLSERKTWGALSVTSPRQGSALKLLVELVGELEREPVLSESKAWLIEALWCAVFEKIPMDG